LHLEFLSEEATLSPNSSSSLLAVFSLSLSFPFSVHVYQTHSLCFSTVLNIETNSAAHIDLRDPSTVPLNFTKSINLALSQRGIRSLSRSNRQNLAESILDEAIPVYGRMIHGRDVAGKLWEADQPYDVHGRVCILAISFLK
jgi:hypothetical protein